MEENKPQNIEKLEREAGSQKVPEFLPEFGGDGLRGFQKSVTLHDVSPEAMAILTGQLEYFECCAQITSDGHDVSCENFPLDAS